MIFSPGGFRSCSATAIAIERTPKMPMYSLDLAFSSTTEPYMPSEPILALSYGFSELPDGGHWGEEGQATLRIERGSTFRFTAFDTATPQSSQVESIRI